MRPCWAQYALWATIIALGTLTLLNGCGAKGDLYRTTKPADTTAPAPVSEPEQPNSTN